MFPFLVFAFFSTWMVAVAVTLLTIRDNRWRLSLPLMFAIVTLVAMILGLFAAAARMDP
jgi:hypothetical protein